MFFGNPAWPFSWPITSIGAGAGATDISVLQTQNLRVG